MVRRPRGSVPPGAAVKMVALAAAAALLPLWYVLALPSGTTGTIVANLLIVVTSGCAALACIVASRSLTAERHAWRWFGVGCATWSLGAVAFGWQEITRDRPMPFPSTADAGQLLLLPCLAVGLVLIARRQDGGRAIRELLLDATIVVVVIVAALAALLPSTLLRDSDASTLALLVAAVRQFGAFAILLLATVVLLRDGDPRSRRSLLILLAGLVALAAGEIVYVDRALTGAFATGSASDLAWIVGFLAVAEAARLAGADRSTIVSDGEPGTHHPRTVLMMVSVLVAAAFGARSIAQPESQPVVAGALLLVGALLAVRIGYAAVLDERLSRRTRERDRMSAVIATSAAIAATTELGDLLRQLTSAAATAVGRARAEVYVFAEDASRIVASASFGLTEEEQAALAHIVDPPVGSFAAEVAVIATRRPVIQDFADPAVLTGQYAPFSEVGKVYSLVAPLLAKDEVVGLFDLWTPHDRHPFDRADIDAVAAIGQQAGLAIYNIRLLEKARQHAETQAMLLRVSQAAVSGRGARELCTEVARASLGIAQAEACGIELWIPESDETEMVAEEAIEEWDGNESIGKRYPLALWPSTRRVIQERRVYTYVTDDPALTQYERDDFRESGTGSILIAPLVLGDECLGVLNLYSRRPVAFSGDDVQVAQELAAQVALAIERARLYDALQTRADTDGLTGLLNRRAVLELLERDLARARRANEPLAVLMVDLDDFKMVNDQHGHLIGDRVLQELAGLLRACVRDGDYVGRYGGDEFLVVLPGVGVDGARAVTARILDRTRTIRTAAGARHLTLAPSIGVGICPSNGVTLHEILAAADADMYGDKSVRRELRALGA